MLYNLVLGFIFLIFSFKILYQRIRYKKYKKTLIWRLGLKKFAFSIPKNKKIVWIHAVSLGEAKSGLIFLEKIKKTYPDFFIVCSTITQTGMRAIEEDSNVDLPIYLPLDFSWIMKRLTKKIQPDYVFLIETDIWPNFLKFAKRFAKVFLVSAKLSERSFKRFKFFSFFTQKIFQYLDHICVQNEDVYQKFLDLKISKDKISVCGNLKYDQKKQLGDLNFWKKTFRIQENDFVITIASTHDTEEILILDELRHLFNKLTILLAPRHPERFEPVRKAIQKYESERIILVDKMGILPSCFQLSRLAIIGGSFIKGIGGHNILEPCAYQIPVLFGPNMEGQKELVTIIKNYQLGWQVQLNELQHKIESLMIHRFQLNPSFQNEIQGSSQKTLDTLKSYLTEML